MTADELGNDHGLQCPKCKKGDELEIAATHWVLLRPDGTDDSEMDGSEEWDDASGAKCNACDWSGKVSELITIELDEEEAEDESRWTNHFFHCDMQWDDVWSCQCDDDCPKCHAEIEPYASTDNIDGSLVIHAQDVYDKVLAIEGAS